MGQDPQGKQEFVILLKLLGIVKLLKLAQRGMRINVPLLSTSSKCWGNMNVSRKLEEGGTLIGIQVGHCPNPTLPNPNRM